MQSIEHVAPLSQRSVQVSRFPAQLTLHAHPFVHVVSHEAVPQARAQHVPNPEQPVHAAAVQHGPSDSQPFAGLRSQSK